MTLKTVAGTAISNASTAKNVIAPMSNAVLAILVPMAPALILNCPVTCLLNANRAT
ncbi:hypothetical protein [Rhizobium sp. Root1203]|uniref:hypothetical protein n=1 Tax=Rhizobium sp. Root1203 TaxID=1736427 RepID=UPI0012E3B608|nr:hypothetical protein [Rhizobium sp. Root1203]